MYGQGCFGRLLAHVVGEKRLDSIETIEWLLLFASVQSAIVKHSI
jgi:hypothetical protein